MAKKPVTRKQLLKEPDQFISFSGKLIEFGRSNLKPILIGVGTLFVLVVILVIINQVSQSNERRASQMVESAMAKYSAALADTDAQTAFERIKPDFEALFAQYGNNHATQLARVMYGDISYDAGDADTAIAMYKHALDDVGQSVALKNIVVSGLAHAYQLKKEYPSAIQYFLRIAEGTDATLKRDAMFNLACLYENAGENEKRRAMLDRLLADFPGSAYEALVREEISG
jgi:tetratricopeptide (TPR) repeat protein